MRRALVIIPAYNKEATIGTVLFDKSVAFTLAVAPCFTMVLSRLPKRDRERSQELAPLPHTAEQLGQRMGNSGQPRPQTGSNASYGEGVPIGSTSESAILNSIQKNGLQLFPHTVSWQKRSCIQGMRLQKINNYVKLVKELCSEDSAFLRAGCRGKNFMTRQYGSRLQPKNQPEASSESEAIHRLRVKT